MKGLLFITHQTTRYSYPDSIEIALRGGCRQVQLRMKDATRDEVAEAARRAMKICAEHGADLYIDDHVEVCHRVGARGVHLGKHDMTPSEARRILGPDSIIGGTANTFDDILRLRDEGVDYIGLGPFRFTTTKKNLSPTLGLDGYSRIIEQCKEHKIELPIVAIGGITRGDITAIMTTGVKAIALSGSILTAVDPIKETEEIIKLII